ncbi:4-hydroxythreonine-4-phosphate dehydrogenase PdxA [Thioflexithrix psekupsensis]|uniref:4-hydroxythreonine-4-phosphate dehydrogenase n=2 Tax=Thioflexithrix psekupsensis TaxID=1570016 RepID=A0A251X938_9GAMM|nr:4-hydroxythreonine-4-phosphate dehydrogenase PdxA [Thioflexithrix psekupsensis]OUD14516.1 4-hydroxythreonine-4-phosphate dehydrogenase PdxA [Thioflexithrix psekupsensis]
MTPATLPTIAITLGEPAGIGVDIVLMLARENFPLRLVVIGSIDLLRQRATLLGIKVELIAVTLQDIIPPHCPNQLFVINIPLNAEVTPGVLNPANAEYVLNTLRAAAIVAVHGLFDAIVTAPVHKGIINAAGVSFSGHTEFFAALTNTPQVVMMLATGKLSVALVTTHVPLAQVSALITPARLESVIRVLYTDLQRKFALNAPRILVCGLNPHAGENGHLGREEMEVIIPVLEKCRAEGMVLIGPVAADTAFTDASLTGIDAVLAMYHDQGLIPLKQRGFGEAVNITLGLPIIRTSVDHGTALELAGTGQAKPNSLRAALHSAATMVLRQQQKETRHAMDTM